MSERTQELLIRSLDEIQRLRQRLAEAEAAASEPIAILAVACRAPGDVSTPDDYWRLFDEGRDAVSPFPARWHNADALYDPDPEAKGKTYAREGGFVSDVDHFDAGFFGISPREAVAMDPQQRLVLEVAWEALERAGLPPTSLDESVTGVYLGSQSSGYGADGFVLEDLDGYRGTGQAGSVVSGRVSYVMGLQGPAITVDTACSSALTALHLACAGLRLGECDLALAGGVQVISTPNLFVEFSRLRGLARDGRCKAFSARADGAGFAEGCGMLVLKRLSDAQAAGDPVLALIPGSAVNQDGRSQGLTAPNGPSQQRVIQKALRTCGLVPNDIDAVEAHGTGTTLGDPIEAGALIEVFGPTRTAERPLWLGSSKSNIGHAQAAAGVLGVIKMVLALVHERMPQTLHADTPSEHIAWADSGVSLVQETFPWPRTSERVRRVGVSSFGISGTNVHVVLEEAPAQRGPTPGVSAPGASLPLLLSGRDEAALRAQAGRWASWLQNQPDTCWSNIVRTAALHRPHFDTRAAVAVHESGGAVLALTALAEGRPHPALAIGQALGGARSRENVVFVFPGQGSQWTGMGRALLGESPVFAEAVATCDAALRPHTGWSVTAVLRGDEGPDIPSLQRVDVVQPALFTMGVGLAAVWRSLSVQPRAVLGHSQGEIVAAVVSGALSVADGAKVVAVRSRLLRQLSGHGGMAVVELPAEVVAQRLQSDSDQLSIAVINTSTSTVISGDDAAIDAFVSQLTEEGTFCRRVDVDYASHSAHMDEILEELSSILADVSPRRSAIPMVSTVTGAPVEGPELDADYWCRNLRETVRLDRALETLLEDDHGVFVEVSAHPVLTMPLTTACAETGGVVTGSLRRDAGGLDVLHQGLAGLHTMGYPVDWAQLLGGVHGQLAALPTYAFQRTRYWLEERSGSADLGSAGLSSSAHPLLGAMTSLADSDEFLFTSRLSLSEHPWIADHAVLDTILMPGTGLVELALAAAQSVGVQTIRELVLDAPLLLPREGALRLQLRVDAPDAQGVRPLAIYSRPDDAPDDTPWVRHASGLCAADGEVLAPPAELVTWPPAGAQACNLDGFYARLAAFGYAFGPTFQGLREAWVVGKSLFGRIVLPEGAAAETGTNYGVHPALLDAALHVSFVASMGAPGEQQVRLPFSWNDVTLHAVDSRELRVCVQTQESVGSEESSLSLTAWDTTGRPVVTVGALRSRPSSVEQLRQARRGMLRDLYRVDWQSVRSAEEAAVCTAEWAVLGGDGGLAELLGATTFADFAALRDALESGVPAPGRLIVDVTSRADECTELAADAHRIAAESLAGLQALLDASPLSSTAIVWVTRSAIAAGPDDRVEDLVHAPLWGLVRSARNEHPERVLRLVDLDATEADAGRLLEVLGLDDEPEVALRNDGRRAARLVAATAQDAEHPSAGAAPALPTDGTVLITGGLGELGQAVARHLVVEHGQRHLLLTSRRGANAPGAAELQASLEELDAVRVTVTACDISDRAAVSELLSSIPEDRRLRAVFHLAGALDDGVVRELTEERLSRVLRPKVDGALHLHAATAGMDLSAFVLFSSGAGVLGGAGQANYAAANSFLDALAAHRRQRGLPGLSLAWGLWEQQGVGLTAHLGHAELSRMRRQGVVAMSVDAGLALLDAALERPEALLVPMRLNLARLRRELASVSTPVPALLRALVRPTLRRVGTAAIDASALRTRLSALPEADRLDALITLVREEAAAVLGLAGLDAVPSAMPLRDLGLDSLMAVELRNRLSARAETALSATLAFDYPTPEAVAGLLLKMAFAELDTSVPIAPPTPVLGDQHEPIAIVAMACHTPGGVTDPEAYWRLLDEGRDAIGPFPARWGNIDAYDDSDADERGESYTTEGGFLDAVDRFDAGFFGISPREATSMDPHQRLALEVAWETLERAGILPASLNESVTGVYLGYMGSDYGIGTVSPETLDVYRGTGHAGSVVSGRIAYVLGLQGPAITVDTACSSSLTALHLAISALRQGECDLALAGGVQVMSTPINFVGASREQVLASDGRCKAFSNAADGPGWAEGCGILLIKRLSDAEAAGDRVLALIRGSAVNQDGRSQGLTAPNGPSQQRVIQTALRRGGLVPSDIDAVEAHGTGTTLGDPIEAGALMEVFGPTRTAERPLWLGSVKSNLGHTQAAAGVLGVIKMVLALQNQRLPQTLHAATPNAHIAWEGSGLALLQKTRPWPRSAERVRRAGVSSFGISGTNAHVVLEEAPSRRAPIAPASAPSASLPLLVSARNEVALRAQAGRWAAWLKEHQADSWPDVVRTAMRHRTHFDIRAALAVHDADEAVQVLTALAEGRPHPAVALGEAVGGAHSGDKKVVFIFPGHGSQWVGMGRGLLDESPVFAKTIAACDDALFPYTGWSVTAVLRGDEGEDIPPLEQVDVVQPVIFTMGLGLAAVWRSLGLEPSAVLGHSVGEIAAAVVSRALSLEDGARLVARRGRLIAAVSRSGAMLSVQLPASELAKRIEPWGDALSVAVVNAADSSVASGDIDAIAELQSEVQAEGFFCRRVAIGFAAHSGHMDEVLGALADELSDLRANATTVPLYSSLTGTVMDGSDLDADYWCRNVRDAVRFDTAVASLVADGFEVFVEQGGHPVLTVPLTTACAGTNGVVTGSLRRGTGGLEVLHQRLASLHTTGYPVDWARLLTDTTGRLAALPTYAFQRERYWLEAHQESADLASAGLSSSAHPLLGAMTSLADSGAVLFTACLSLSEHPWLADHAVSDTVLMPGTGLVELALAAAQAVGAQTIRELVLGAPLILPKEGALRLQLSIDAPDANGVRSLAIYSRASDTPADAPEETPWTRHASGLCAAYDEVFATPVELTTWPPAGARAIDLEGLYARAASRGYGYGPTFQGLREAWVAGDTLFGRVALPEAIAETAEDYGVHPALLDAALHVSFAASMDAAVDDERVQLPFSWNDVTLHAVGARELRVRLQIRESAGPDESSMSLTAWDTAGRPVATVGALRTRTASVEQLRRASRGTQRDLYRVDWQPMQVPVAAAVRTAEWAVLGGDGRLATLLGVTAFADLAALREALDTGTSAPGRLILDATLRPEESTELVADVHRFAADALVGLQGLLEAPKLDSTALVWATRSAVATGPDDRIEDLVHAPLWGLVRSARFEHPERILRLIDLDAIEPDPDQLRAMLGADDEPELAVRFGRVSAPRLLVTSSNSRALEPPADADAWQLRSRETGSIDGLQLVASSEPLRPLAADEVRVDVRALGLNFLDVVRCLGMVNVSGRPLLGEGAGVVLEVGAKVLDLAPGCRVFGFMTTNGGTMALSNRALLSRIPDRLSFVEAATLPVNYLTVLYGLQDLGGLRAGERVLIHAATGGTGMAAVRVARRIGAEVFATASPAKHRVLREQGFDDAHIANSRDLSFEEAVLSATAGEGVDVVLNSLAGDFVDASLRLLPRGGRFLEMGKTDIRDASDVRDAHPRVEYRAFDMADAGLERMQTWLGQVAELFEEEQFSPPPSAVYDLRHATSAFRYMAEARHVGKLVLQPPRSLDPAGTVLITGGVGELGQAVARHLVAEHGLRHLLLTSRRGMNAPRAPELQVSLENLGATHVTIVACDITDRAAVAELLSSIPGDRPLCAVFHLAGVLDDGVVRELTEERLSRVLRPKVDGALNLHELTADMDLSAFVFFSSGAGVMGGAGQANYAAANSFLDALAAHRRKRGLPGLSLAWGLWEQQGVGMTARLGHADLARMRRQGVVAMSVDAGLALLDAALERPEALLVPMRLNAGRMQRELASTSTQAPALLRALIRPAMRRVDAFAVDATTLRSRLSVLPEADRLDALVALVREEVAAVLGLAGPDAVPVASLLSEQGLDSLMAVELRNRLGSRTQTTLPTTLAFDYPSPQAVAGLLLERLELASSRELDDEEIRRKLNSVSIAALRSSGLLDLLMAQAEASAVPADTETFEQDFDELSDDEVLRMFRAEVGVAE